MPGPAGEIIDFRIERGRHAEFFARQDVLDAIDRHLTDPAATHGWVLVTGGPGLGKSAILTRWLDRAEKAGQPVAHHFLRRGVSSWDRPEAVERGLAAQIEARYPAMADPDARPEARLLALLDRVSRGVLMPRGERLVLLVDGLDEAESAPGDNPLPRFLPYAVPPGVFVLCASRPQYPHLGWLEARDRLRRIDLDTPAWSASNAAVCHAFWACHAPRFAPPLDRALVAAIEARGQGNVLYAVKLREWLADLPAAQRTLARIPQGFAGFLGQIWAELLKLPEPRLERVAKGLGLLCAAREALPLSVLETVAGFGGLRDKDDFLAATRSLLLEEPEHWAGERAYRPFHEAFRGFIAEQLGPERMRGHHRTLLETVARWPPAEGGFFRRYALRHAVTHALEAGQREEAEARCRDLGFIESWCQEAGVEAAEEGLRQAAAALREDEIAALHRAIRAESHWIRREPGALPALVYNRLRSSGWEAERIARRVHFRDGLPAVRLRFPVRMGGERTLVGHTGWVLACAVTPDGQRVVSASYDKTLKVWELATGNVLATLHGHKGVVTACAVMPDGQRLVSASEDKTLKVWELATGNVLATLHGHEAVVTACAVTPDGKRVVSASYDKTLKVWELATGNVLATLRGHEAVVTACAVAPDGKRVVSASRDKALKVWEVATGNMLSTLHGHEDRVTACAVTPDGKRVVSASSDKTLKVWELATGNMHSTLHGHENVVTACTVTPDGKRVVSASSDKTLKVWELTTGNALAILLGHEDRVTACAVTPDGKRVVSASRDKTLKIWELATGNALANLHRHEDRVTACAVTPDGKRVVSASDDKTLKVWELATGNVLATLHGHDWVTACAVTSDGKRVISASDDKTLKVWELATGNVLSTLHGHEDRVTACTVTSDGKRVISASDDKTLKVWELATGNMLSTLHGHDWVTACAVTPDGKRVVSAFRNKTLKVWEVATGNVLADLHGHENGVTACAVTPDGKRVVSASYDDTLKVWDLATGKALATLRGHEDGVTACAVTPDGRRVISASWDKTLGIWDLETGERLATVHGTCSFESVTAARGLLCAGDALGNLWILDTSPPSRPSAVTSPRNTPVRLFYSYAHKDEPFREALETHLKLLHRQGLLESWHDRSILPGTDWAAAIDDNLEKADIILLLVSADFLASDYCFDREMKRALARHHAGEARVIPIALRPVDWTGAPFAGLQALPRDARPITQWPDRDEAWTDVAKGLRKVITEIRAARAGGA